MFYYYIKNDSSGSWLVLVWSIFKENIAPVMPRSRLEQVGSCLVGTGKKTFRLHVNVAANWSDLVYCPAPLAILPRCTLQKWHSIYYCPNSRSCLNEDFGVFLVAFMVEKKFKMFPVNFNNFSRLTLNIIIQ